MNLTRVVLGIHWVPLLSGCLMGGMAHTGGIGRGEIGPMQGPLQHAEASSGELTIALSFPIPSTATAVPMEARLGTASDRREPTDGEIWLRIQTPAETSTRSACSASIPLPEGHTRRCTASGTRGPIW